MQVSCFKADSYNNTFFCDRELHVLGAGNYIAQLACDARMHCAGVLSHYRRQGFGLHIEQIFWLSKMESQQGLVLHQYWGSYGQFCLLFCCSVLCLRKVHAPSLSLCVSVSFFLTFLTVRMMLKVYTVTSETSTEPSLNLRSTCNEWLMQNPVLKLWVKEIKPLKERLFNFSCESLKAI